MQEHEKWMNQALQLAQQAGDQDEVPVGAVLVEAGELIGSGFNQVIGASDPTAHAEIIALRAGSQFRQNYRLPGTVLYVTIEPCTMCFGAVLWSGVRSLVIAGDGPELEEITGFDEGPIHPEWRKELDKRGIELAEDVLRKDAIEAYKEFSASRDFVYNARLGSSE